jgi:oligoendopeptidase F
MKPIVYFHLARDIFGEDRYIQSQVIQLDNRVTKAMNLTLFFELGVGKISQKLQKEILSDKRSKPYRYYLIHLWKEARYYLSEEVEKVLALKGKPSYELWVDGTEKLIADQVVVWKGKKIPIHQATGMVSSLPERERPKLHRLIVQQLQSISYFPEQELNAIILNKKIDDDLRGFSKPYSATVLEYENNEQEIITLMETIHKNQKIAHRLYTLKAKLMHKKNLLYSDIGVTLSGKKQKFSFDDAVTIVRNSLQKTHPDHVAIFDQYLNQGQIDVVSRVGKRGGGYCWGGHGRPTYVLLNWADELHSVTTLAHEMGHGIHAEYSKGQNVFHESHPISTAEVASTLFENFTFDELLLQLSPEEQVYARFNKLQDAVATIFRQSAYFRYELAIHQQVTEQGKISADQFAQIMQKELQQHLGRSVVVSKDDGYLWVRYMHARWFFYVYSYAYGQLISTAMYTQYQKDPSFIEKINQFLSAGGSDTPVNIFKSIGIDTTKADFWEQGIRTLDQEITNLEKECKKLRLI